MGMLLSKKHIAIEILFSTLISWLIFHVPEEAYEVPRYYWLYLATIAVLVYIAYIRKIKITDIKAWLYLLVCAGVLLAVWRIKGINPANYGEEYSTVLRLRHICYGLFIGLMLDLFRHKPFHLRQAVKKPLLWIYVAFTLVGSIASTEDIIPLIIPVYALLLTEINSEKWTELMDCFAVGYYLVYFKMFTGSLLFARNIDASGRYLGAFTNLSTTGIHVSIAVLCGLYFFIRWLWSERDKRKLVVLILLWLYPIVVLFMVNSRSAEFGLIGAFLAAFVFLHGKDIPVTKKRVIIAGVICIAGMVCFVLLANILASLRIKGVIEELPYGLDHIALFGYNYEDGYFNSSLLNKINAFSSQRLIDWVELIKQARLFGGNADKLYTHNVYVFYIIKYGFVGGGLVIVWAVSYVITGIIHSMEKDTAFIMPLLYGFFALLAEVGMNGYWMLPLGYYWVLFNYPLAVCLTGKNLHKDI